MHESKDAQPPKWAPLSKPPYGGYMQGSEIPGLGVMVLYHDRISFIPGATLTRDKNSLGQDFILVKASEPVVTALAPDYTTNMSAEEIARLAADVSPDAEPMATCESAVTTPEGPCQGRASAEDEAVHVSQAEEPEKWEPSTNEPVTGRVFVQKKFDDLAPAEAVENGYVEKGQDSTAPCRFQTETPDNTATRKIQGYSSPQRAGPKVAESYDELTTRINSMTPLTETELADELDTVELSDEVLDKIDADVETLCIDYDADTGNTKLLPEGEETGPEMITVTLKLVKELTHLVNLLSARVEELEKPSEKPAVSQAEDMREDACVGVIDPDTGIPTVIRHTSVPDRFYRRMSADRLEEDAKPKPEDIVARLSESAADRLEEDAKPKDMGEGTTSCGEW